jgi:hypothetical protein
VSRIERSRGSRAKSHVMAVVSMCSALALPLAGCESETGLASGDYPGLHGGSRPCTGAFTPHSEVCWDDSVSGDGGQVSADMSASQENMADVEGQDRCLQGIIPTPGPPGKLTVSFTTVPVDGLYTPRNCGAVWIEDSLLSYVRTLELWTAERQMSLVQWNSRVCHADPTVTAPDVITSATLPGPKMHTSTWDSRDFRGAVVPDGTYTLWMQVAENEIFPEGPFVKIPIVKGPTPFSTGMPFNQPGFSGITVTYTPDGAAPVAAP